MKYIVLRVQKRTKNFRENIIIIEEAESTITKDSTSDKSIDNESAEESFEDVKQLEVGGIDFYDYQICRREKFYRIATVL